MKVLFKQYITKYIEYCDDSDFEEIPHNLKDNFKFVCNDKKDYKLPITNYVYIIWDNFLYIPKGYNVNDETIIVNLLNTDKVHNIEDFDVYYIENINEEENSFDLAKVKTLFCDVKSYSKINFINCENISVVGLNRHTNIYTINCKNKIYLEPREDIIYVTIGEVALVQKNKPFPNSDVKFCHLDKTYYNVDNIDDFDFFMVENIWSDDKSCYLFF